MSKHKAKRVSNYELFFDLAVVLAISQLTSAFHVQHIGFSEMLSFFAACIIMLNIWNNEAFYYNKYGDSRRIDIYSVIVLMLWVGNLALSFNFDVAYLRNHYSNVLVFNSMLILCYGTIALQYYLKGRKLGFNQDIKTSIGLLIAYMLLLLPVATGIISYSNWVVVLYFLPLILPLILHLSFFKRTAREIFWQPINFPHALERNQLLTIVTFGESVIATIKTYPLMTAPLEGALLFFGMAGLFMFYIIQTFINIDHHQHTSIYGLFYSHAIIIVSLLFFTVGLEFMADHHHHNLGITFFIISVIAFYIGVLFTSVYNQEIYRVNKTILSKYAGFLAVGSLAFYFFRNNLILVGVSLIIMNYLIMRSGMAYRRQQRERNQVPHPDPNQNLRDFS
ncbi:low temperature requirement protein A [Streptococcus troglodytae]|uniref:Low temperature requirement protein LtrA n=1 Tax=Streptococcus troglodytae TaxID=1111760 RepID=A0A1L7LK11_9STRE|nr:low temperature requirement protein A [Streptococcus troglodytae]BAQ24499.1 Low temperature requirement protein LtrA [Streptococcus troglodytae]